MKTSFSLLATALFFTLSLASCDSPQESILDTNAQVEMDRKSYDVTSFERYNHSSEVSSNVSDNYDEVHLTFKSSQLFLTKTTMTNGANNYRFEEFRTDFRGGVLQGIWLDEDTYLSTVFFERSSGNVTIEFEGTLDDAFHSVFITMTELDGHPAGAAQISGLPG